MQAIPVEPNSFDSRKKLPAEWQGLRDDVLSEKVFRSPSAIHSIKSFGFSVRNTRVCFCAC